ncbi:MAG: hypothetical protein RLP44_25985 [Aggregatilineales bacterium]
MPSNSTQRNQSLLQILLRPWFIVTLCCLLYGVMFVIANDGDSLALVTIGSRFSEGIDDGTEGYDGQFVYYIARDPSSAADLLDVPAYRFQRILLPFLGLIFSFGNDAILPWVLFGINLIALGAGTAILEGLLREHGASRWYALGYGFAVGTLGAARLCLPEPLTYALVLGGIVLLRRDRWIWGAILFALAGLAKETGLIFTGGYGLYLLYQREWFKAVIFGAITGIPFAVWQLVLHSRLGEFGIGSGGAGASSFEIVPFGGILRILTGSGDLITYQFETLPYANDWFIHTRTIFAPPIILIFFIFFILLLPFAIYPTVWGLRECWKAFKANALTPIVFLLFANALIMLFVPFSTYREPLGILRFVVGLQIAVVLYAAEKHSKRALLNSTIWGYTIFLMLAWDLSSINS